MGKIMRLLLYFSPFFRYASLFPLWGNDTLVLGHSLANASQQNLQITHFQCLETPMHRFFLVSSVLLFSFGCSIPSGKCVTANADGSYSVVLNCTDADTSDTGIVDSADTGDSDSAPDTDSTDTGDSDSAHTGDSDSAETGDTGDSDSDSAETGDTGDSDTDTAVDPTDADADGFNADDDCDDADAAINPDAVEICDNVDNNCDGVIDTDALDQIAFYADADSDGYGDAAISVLACDPVSGYVIDNTDCDDTDDTIHPYATEDCTDMTDLNCDGSVGAADADGDGTVACEDCDDTNANAYPGNTETCDGVDNDCEGTIDIDAVDALTWYADSDGDAYGDALVTEAACSASAGYVSDDTDCDDTNAGINPGQVEQCDGSATDENCNGLADDADSTVLESGKSSLYHDADGDTYGDLATETLYCSSPDSSWIGDSSDCDDTDAGINPGAIESCNSADDDCDGDVDESGSTGESTWYADSDSDGYGDASVTEVACSASVGYVADDTDCDDTDTGINPGEVELCDSVDNDCDTDVDEGALSTFYLDDDGDGYGDASVSEEACSASAGYVSDDTDCDDSASDIYPGAIEVCDGTDQDCDGDDDNVVRYWYVDADGDGYGDTDRAIEGADCLAGGTGIAAGAVSDETDSDDADPAVH